MGRRDLLQDNLGVEYAKELDKYREISNYLETLLFPSRKDRLLASTFFTFTPKN